MVRPSSTPKAKPANQKRAPTFAPLTADSPTTKPISALQEAVARYLPRYLPRSTLPAPGGSSDEGDEADPSGERVRTSLASFGELLELAGRSGATVAVAQHRPLLARDGFGTVAEGSEGSNEDTFYKSLSFE